MTIPHDPLKRKWLDASSVNSILVDQLRPVLIGLLAYDRNHYPVFQGTGFIVGGGKDAVVVFTAKHVLEGVQRVQRPDSRHAPSSPFVTASAVLATLDPAKVRGVWMGNNHADLLEISFVNYNNELDLAVCIMTPQECYKDTFAPACVAFDFDPPIVGDIVHMVSLSGMSSEELEPPVCGKGTEGQLIEIRRTVNIRLGTVTAVYPENLRQYGWPCFTTSIPAEPGMSGGFVYRPKPNGTMAVLGIVCADNSTNEASTDCFVAGESVIASAWTAVSMQLPTTIGGQPGGQNHFIYDLIKDGQFTPVVGDFQNIEFVDAGDGNCSMKLTG